MRKFLSYTFTQIRINSPMAMDGTNSPADGGGSATFEILYPSEEGAEALTPIPADADENDIEIALESYIGKAEVIDGTIFGEMPDCDVKARIPFAFYDAFYSVAHDTGADVFPGTIGVTFLNRNTLSPDACIHFPGRINPIEVQEHLRQPGRAPNFVFEFEWLEEVHDPRKGYDKILNYYFSPAYVGINDDAGHVTRVDEAWLLVRSLRKKRYNLPNDERRPSNDPAVQLLLAQSEPPSDVCVPYLVVFIRRNPPAEHVVAYYHLDWNTKFEPPAESLLHGTLFVNNLLSRMV